MSDERMNELLDEIHFLKQQNQQILAELQEIKSKLAPNGFYPYLLNYNSRVEHKINTLLVKSINGVPNKARQQINVLFILHNMYTWSALKLIYEELTRRENVKVFVIAASAQHSQQNLMQKSYSAKLVDFLKQEKIPFQEVDAARVANVSAFLASVNPDLIIRQSPWDNDLPEIFSSLNLSNYKTIYIPYYTVDIVDFQQNGVDMELNQNFHLFCHKIYFPSQDLLLKAKQQFLGDTSGLKFLGNTKLEYITSQISPKQSDTQRPLHLLWAPHHSLNNEMLAFGTFDKHCMEMIRLAKKYPTQLHICLRPHPLLFAKLEQLDAPLCQTFKQEWQALPNTSIDEHWDYIPSFNWSDVLFTDGLSFLIEYPFTNKPSIFMEAGNHKPFTLNGELGKACAYTISQAEEIEPLIQQALTQSLSAKTDEIIRLKTHLLTDNAAQKIVDDMLSDL